MNIAELFQRKRLKDAESKKPIRTKYMQLVRDLAAGKELDEADVWAITDAMGVSEAEWSNAVSTMATRVENAARLRKAKQAEKDSLEAEQRIAVLNEEYSKFMQAWQPKINAAVEKYKAAESEKPQYHAAESMLIRTCIDPDILERQAALDRRRAEVVDGLLELQAAADRAQGRVKYFESTVESAKILNSKDPKALSDIQGYWLGKKHDHRVTEAMEVLNRERQEAQPIFDELAARRRKIAELDKEQTALNLEKLRP